MASAVPAELSPPRRGPGEEARLWPEEGAPGRDEGVPLPGPGCLLRGPGLAPRSQPGFGCCLGALESGADSPFLARAESPGRARALGLGACYILTSLPGPPGRAPWPPRMVFEG